MDDEEKEIPNENFFIHEMHKERIFFDFFNAEIGINVDSFPQEFFKVVSILQEDCDFNLNSIYKSMDRLFVEGEYQEEKCELILRYGGYGDELVVARVKFIHTRQGKMTELYRILKMIRMKYKTSKIVIENVQTKEMKNWCIKNGFTEDYYREGCYIDSGI